MTKIELRMSQRNASQPFVKEVGYALRTGRRAGELKPRPKIVKKWPVT
jgi:hypothetical protein